MSEAKRILDVCASCAQSIWADQQPSLAYASRTAEQLFMTLAHESDLLKARRQYGYGQFGDKGAFGLVQIEWATIQTCLRRLVNRPKMRERAVAWIADNGLGTAILDEAQKTLILYTLQTSLGDPLGILLARMNYLGVAEPIPATPAEMAQYAKDHHNTEAGVATPELYLGAFNTLMAEAILDEAEDIKTKGDGTDVDNDSE